jgi:hypothetical protein
MPAIVPNSLWTSQVQRGRSTALKLPLSEPADADLNAGRHSKMVWIHARLVSVGKWPAKRTGQSYFMPT